MTATANRVITFLKRTLKKCPNSIKEKGIYHYVRPITEYASTAWGPIPKKTQRKQKKSKGEMQHLLGYYERTAPVTTMVQNLGWPTLLQRRSYTNLVMVFVK